MSWSNSHTEIRTLTQLHHCVLIIKIFKCHASEHILAVIKDEKLWRTKMAVSKCPCLTFMSYLDTKISLVRCICSSSYLQPYWPCNTHPKKQGHQATKIHTPRPLTYQLFFQNRYCVYKLPCIRAQVELSNTFVYDYKMSTSGDSARNSHFAQEHKRQ